MRLKQCLMETNTSLLRAIASYRRFDFKDSPGRSETLTLLSQQLIQPAAFEETVNQMTSWELEILYQIKEAGGQLRLSRMQATWGNDDSELDRRWFWHENVSRGLSRLRLAGLIFLTRSPDESEHVYTFPEEYADRFKSPPFIVEHGDYAPYTYHSSGITILSDVYQLALYFDQFRVRPLRNDTLPKRHKQVLLRRLQEITPCQTIRTPGYLDLLYKVMKNLEFISVLKGQIRILGGLENWLERSQYQQIKDLFKTWMGLDDQVDLETICRTKIVSAGLRHPPIRVKRALVNLIKNLPLQWISMADFSRYFQHNRPFFYRPDHSPGIWRLIDVTSGETISAHAIWNRLENRILGYMLGQCLGLFGLVNMGVDKQGEFEGFHITELGRAVLLEDESLMSDQPNEPLNQIIVQPDFDVLTPASVVLSVRDRLEKVAEFVQGGHMQSYRITRNSIAHAMEIGMTSGEIIHFLDTAARDGLPPNVRMSVNDWIGEFGKIEFSREMIMRTDDEFLMQEILSRPVTNRLISEEIGPTTALVDEGNVESIIAEMKRVGYLPRFAGPANGLGNMVPISLTLDISQVALIRNLLTEHLKDIAEDIDNKTENMIIDLLMKLDQSLGEKP